LDASNDEWKEPVLQLLLHTCGNLEQLLRSKYDDGDDDGDDDDDDEENEDDEGDDWYYDEDDEDDDNLLLQLLLSLEKEVFLLYLSSDDLKVTTEDSVLHLINLWIMKNTDEPPGYSYKSYKSLRERWHKEQAELADDLLVALRFPSLSPAALCFVLPNMSWFEGTHASKENYMLAACFAQNHFLNDCSVIEVGTPRKQYEVGATLTFTSSLDTELLVNFIKKTLQNYKKDPEQIHSNEYSMKKCYGLGRSWSAVWSFDTSPAGRHLSLYIASMFPLGGGSDSMEVPWLMKGIEVAVGGKVYKLDEGGNGDGGFRKGRQLAVVDPLGLGSLPQEWSKKDWKAKGLPLKGKIKVKVTIRGMAHAGCKE
jgi:hypothetical protein